MKKLLSFIICLTVINLCYAQHAVIKGNVTDTLNHAKLSGSVVALLHAKDSVLYKFTRTGESGQFSFSNLPAGKFLLMITYPAFADYVEPLTLADTSVVDLDKVMLTLKSRLLQEVVINQKVAAIKMKGDTTEFNADSYKTQANATVEDLLKKLPGIQVDNKGQITAQGEKIKKVLVDGEEFFGDDPTLVTQNLRADMVDKVQLYDKKSDQAAFTGVDDGEAAKTLNLKLKENKKNGYFGKLKAGAGTQGFHESEGMINIFRKKMKFAAYGIVSNTGKTGLNWQDRDKFGQSDADNAITDPSGDIYFMGSGDDLETWDGNYSGKGYPLVQTGGLHFNNKWDQDKKSVNGNYKMMKLYMDGNNTTNTQNILPDNTTTYRNVSESFQNSILRNRVNGAYDIQIDSFASVKIMADGGIDHKVSSSNFLSEFLGSDSSLINRNNRQLSSVGDNRTFNSNVLWRQKFRKTGRTLAVNLSENYSRNTGDGYLNSFTEYFNKSVVDSSQHTDQYKTNNTENVNVNLGATYTEPLSKYSSLIFNYGLSVNNSHSNRNSFNRNGDGKYDLPDTTYSNDYAFNMVTNKGGLSYSYQNKKLRITAGNQVGYTGYHQQDMYRNVSRNRNFVNWFPSANVRYNFSQQRRLMFWYNGSTRQPNMSQLQPFRSNEDEQDVRIGNPDLKPTFHNNFRLNYMDYKVISERNTWISLNYTTKSNDFGEYSTIDEKGRRVTRAVNIDGNQDAGLNVNMGWKIKSINVNIGYYLRGNYYRNGSFINDQLNITKSTNSVLGLNLYSSKEKKYDTYFAADAAYNTSTSSVQQSLRTNYWTYNIVHSMQLFFPWKIQLNSEINFHIRQKTAVFTGNNNAIIWNASLIRKFGKKELVQINVSVNDLLNQNIGFNRSVNSNFITQNTYSTISRYGLVSFIWNFNKAGGAAPKN